MSLTGGSSIKQLDLLLLKAESYSNFILENQKRSQSLAITKDSIAQKSSSGSHGGDSKENEETDAAADKIQVSADTSFKQPPNLSGGSLLPYQLEGLQWLLSLWENGLNGILADEMGLGKTIQIISLIAQLRHNNTSGPFLIAGPLATLHNWVNEFKKWLPSCPVILYHGDRVEREELRKKHMPTHNVKSMNFPVIVTNFEMLISDRQYLEQYVWQYIILDEGHRIKNRNCKLLQELKSIKSISRLLLTGTPIQNSLEELWSLLNFCSPMIFDDLEVFKSWFGFKNIGKDTKVEDILGTEQEQRIVTKLHEILRPFLLRRLKKDVLIRNPASDAITAKGNKNGGVLTAEQEAAANKFVIPPKVEVVVYCGMAPLQREYYALVLKSGLRDALIAMGVDGAKRLSQLNPVMQQRKVCNHPFLFGDLRDAKGRSIQQTNPNLLAKASGKFKLLVRMLPKLQQQGHKVLIFSQMTELLNILEDFVALSDYKYCRFDGSTKLADRQAAIDEFNDPASGVFLFLLSTRSGGLGVNLATADTVIIFDSDWNPHQDSQAQDRAHRIGQQNPVVVYRFLTSGSVEIDMMAKQISKKKLERLAIQGGDFRKAGKRATGCSLSLNDLRRLLEDDVKNLAARGPASVFESSSCGIGGGDNDLVESSANGAALSLQSDITDQELDFIMNRDLLFEATSTGISNSISSNNTSSGGAPAVDVADVEQHTSSSSSSSASNSTAARPSPRKSPRRESMESITTNEEFHKKLKSENADVETSSVSLAAAAAATRTTIDEGKKHKSKPFPPLDGEMYDVITFSCDDMFLSNFK